MERERQRRRRCGRGKGVSGVTNGMGRYEGEVIQLLSNLGATLLGGELVGGRKERGEARSCRALPPPTIEPR